MVRQGTLVFLILGLAACTQGVDDPANFTAGNSQGQTAASSSTGGEDTDSATGVATGNQDGTTGSSNTNTAPDDTTGGGATSATTTTTGVPGDCGNGVIDAGEQCDGADLQGFTCDSLGLSGGTLACDGTMCTFDTSMCMSTSGTSG
jgi:hypothetical protein